jgi:hypothetical protein
MNKPVSLDFFDEQGWKEVAEVSHANWQAAVANGETSRGYMAYVAAELEAAGQVFSFEDPEIELEVFAADPEVPQDVAHRFPPQWWKEEVAALDTRRGYAAWATAQQDALDEEMQSQAEDGLLLMPDAVPQEPAPSLSRPRRRGP